MPYAVCDFKGVYLVLALRWALSWPDVWPLAYPIPPLQLGVFALLGVGYDIYSMMNQQQGIAFGAHVGGFLAGLTIAAIITQMFATEKKHERACRKVVKGLRVGHPLCLRRGRAPPDTTLFTT